MKFDILEGDVLERLAELPDNSFDAVLSDPPYGLSPDGKARTTDEIAAMASGARTGFMGKAWDAAVPGVSVWRDILRVLKPGGYVLAFGGTRTFHRMVCAIEDAGFEVRDCLMWVYASGFPKSQNISIAIDKDAGAMGHRGVGVNVAGRGDRAHLQAAGPVPAHEPITALAKAWDGYGSSLKPAWEPITLARKPLDGTMANNVAKWGVGGLAIDACRIGIEAMPKTRSDGVLVSTNLSMGGGNTGRIDAGTSIGRWPANLLLDDEAGALLDEMIGDRPSGAMSAGTYGGSRTSVSLGRFGEFHTSGIAASSGGASRFFYSAKVSRAERNAGTAHIEKIAMKFIWGNEAREVQLQVDAGLSVPRVTYVSGATCSSASEWSTILFGSPSTELFREECKYTIATGTSSITESRTLRWLMQEHTSVFTADVNCEEESGVSPALSAENSSELAQQTGTSEGTRRSTRGADLATLRELFERSESVVFAVKPASDHPTLKPISLTTYLAKLLLPPNASRILVPYSGAGSEMIGCLRAGWKDVLGIELSPEYIEIARARIKRALANPPKKERKQKAKKEKEKKTKRANRPGLAKAPVAVVNIGGRQLSLLGEP